MKQDAYKIITDKLIELIESTEGEQWQMPWHHQLVLPQNATSKKAYRGVNTISLWVGQMANGYQSPLWATYKQWQDMGAQVKKGEKSTPIVFYKTYEVETENSEDDNETRMFARVSYVFNAAQVEGFTAPAQPKNDGIDDHAAVLELVTALNVPIKHGMAGAYYHRKEDYIGMPNTSSFKATAHSSAFENYYSTLLHEMTHATGATQRLDREKGKKFGDEAYAFEELIAEIGAAMLCAETGIASTPRPDHAHYLASWLKKFKNDKRYLFQAASQAQKAVDYLLELREEQKKVAA